MTPLHPTPFELGRRHPSELFPTETRITVIDEQAQSRRAQHRTLSADEFARRQTLVRRVVASFGSVRAAGQHLGIERSFLNKMANGQRAVPDKHLAKLEACAGRRAA